MHTSAGAHGDQKRVSGPLELSDRCPRIPEEGIRAPGSE